MEFEMRDSPPPYYGREQHQQYRNVTTDDGVVHQPHSNADDNMSRSNKDEASNASSAVHSSHRGEENEEATYQSFHDVDATATANQMEDHAALFVMLYLLFIFGLIVLAIVIGLFVVIQYGLVVLVAVCVAVFGLLIVAATLMSVITRDAKLSKARGKIKSWHVTCKEEILKEIENFKEDLHAYKHGMLLLTYDETYVDGTGGNNAANQDVKSKDTTNKSSATSKERKPKSILFRFAVAPFIKSKKKQGGQNSNSSQGKKKKRIWSRNKKKKNNNPGAEKGQTEYHPPNL